MDQRPIGVFDSGIGGLTVVRELFRQLPGESIVYFGDTARVPYGTKSDETVRNFALQDARFLVQQDVKLIVVACNTASAAALYHLRETFPEVPFVGMEPAVKPAAEQTQTGVVGVLATPATFQGRLYASVVERFANGVRLLAVPNTETPTLTVRAVFAMGQRDEPPGSAGLASLTGAMMGEATKRRTAAEFAEELERIGATIGVRREALARIGGWRAVVPGRSAAISPRAGSRPSA